MLFFKRNFMLLLLLIHPSISWSCLEATEEKPPGFSSTTYEQLSQHMPDFYGKMTREEALHARSIEDQRPIFLREKIPPFLIKASSECTRSFVPQKACWTDVDGRSWYVVDHNVNPGPNQKSYPLGYLKKSDPPYELVFGSVVKSPLPESPSYFGYYFILYNNHELGKKSDLYFTLYAVHNIDY